MKVVLADLNIEIIEAWRAIMPARADIAMHHGSIFDVQCDALISPANSFGYMDGGLDLAISQYFGWHVQDRAQEAIKARHHGELLVGTAEMVATDHADIPYVILAPTMRVPTVLGAESVNPYLAMRAVILLVEHGTFPDGTPIKAKVQTVAVPGLGTGVGRVPPEICARQMYAALDDHLWGQRHFPGSWLAAVRTQERLTAL
ncbi:MAG: Appr-1-p processing protein [Chloroflexi bacterium]|nr:Appr-1-p processing protein [Chloroflexota bacterium]